MAELKPEDIPQDISELTAESLAEEVGTTGLQHSGGRVIEEFMSRLRDQRQAMRVYREMGDNDPTIGAIIYLLTAFATTVEYRIEPKGEDQAQLDAAEFVTGCMGDMSHTWTKFVTQAISFLQYGFAWHEIIYKERQGPDNPDPKKRSEFDDGKIGWRKLAVRSQDSLSRWKFNRDGETIGMYQYDFYPFETEGGGFNSETFIPSAKSIHFQNSAYKDNPEGKSLFRNAVRPWWFLKRFEEIEAIGAERDATGLPVLQVPQEILAKGAGATNKKFRDLAFKMVRNIRRDASEGIVLPSETDRDGNPTGWKLDLLTSGGRRQFNILEIKKGKQTEILSTVLMQFMKMGTDKVGSFSLASRMTNLFAVAFSSILDNFVETFTQQAIRPLMRLNGFPRETWPRMIHGDFEDVPLDEIGSFIETLAKVGIPLADQATQRKLREIADLPEPPDEEELARMREEAQANLPPQLRELPGESGSSHKVEDDDDEDEDEDDDE